MGVYVLALCDVARRTPDWPTVLMYRRTRFYCRRGEFVPPGDGGCCYECLYWRSDGFAALHVAQGDQHVVARMNSQQVGRTALGSRRGIFGNRYHMPMVTGIRNCANVAVRRPESASAVGRKVARPVSGPWSATLER